MAECQNFWICGSRSQHTWINNIPDQNTNFIGKYCRDGINYNYNLNWNHIHNSVCFKQKPCVVMKISSPDLNYFSLINEIKYCGKIGKKYIQVCAICWLEKYWVVVFNPFYINGHCALKNFKFFSLPAALPHFPLFYSNCLGVQKLNGETLDPAHNSAFSIFYEGYKFCSYITIQAHWTGVHLCWRKVGERRCPRDFTWQ